MSALPQISGFYWIRLYRDNAQWEPAQRVVTDYGDGWRCLGVDDDYYDTEVNEVGPQIVPPCCSE